MTKGDIAHLTRRIEMNSAILHHYRQNRAHQMSTYGNSGLHILRNGQYVDAREFTGGPAAYGFHAVAAYQSARSHIHFMKTLKADIAAHKKRSRGAKRGWKARRAA